MEPWVIIGSLLNQKGSVSRLGNFVGSLKVVLHPWSILCLFMHISQKIQHIGDK